MWNYVCITHYKICFVVQFNLGCVFTSVEGDNVLPIAAFTICCGVRVYEGGGASWFEGWSVAGCCVAPIPP